MVDVRSKSEISTMIRSGGHEARGNAAGAIALPFGATVHVQQDMATGSEPDTGSRNRVDSMVGAELLQMGPRRVSG